MRAAAARNEILHCPPALPSNRQASTRPVVTPPFLDCTGDFLHSFVAGACAKHLAAGHEAVHDGQQSQQYCYEN